MMIRTATLALSTFLFWQSGPQPQVQTPAVPLKNISVSLDSTNLKAGDTFPGISFLDTEGKEVKVSDLKGKYIYIDVWASWCYPCRKEYPALKALRDRMKDKAINFVGISCDTRDDRWKGALRDEKMDGIQWILKKEERSFMKLFKVGTVPRYILIDKKGKIINMEMSRPSDPKTEEFINALKHI